MVVAENSTELLAAIDCSAARQVPLVDQPDAEPLVVPFSVVLDVLVDGSPEKSLPEEDHPFEALLDGTHEALGVSVAVRCPAVRLHDSNAGGSRDALEQRSEPPVVVADQEAAPRQTSEDRVGQVAGDVAHELVIWSPS